MEWVPAWEEDECGGSGQGAGGRAGGATGLPEVSLQPHASLVYQWLAHLTLTHPLLWHAGAQPAGQLPGLPALGPHQVQAARVSHREQATTT